MDKKQKIERKIQRRLKNRSKHTKLNIENLRREIHAYEFHFFDQPPWNQSYPTQREQNGNAVKIRPQQHESLEVRE